MTTQGLEDPTESGAWLRGTSARQSEIPRAARAIHSLGNLVMHVVDDPEEARRIVAGIKRAELQQRYPDAPQVDIDRYAAAQAEKFVADMQPSPPNSHDPFRLIRVVSTDGRPVLLDKIYDEIRDQVNRDIAQGSASLTGTTIPEAL